MDTPTPPDDKKTERRIYVQLAPDSAGRDDLVDIQSQLPIPRSGRMLPPEELHMTLIHFGKVDDVFESVRKASGVARETYDAAVQVLIEDFTGLKSGATYALIPRGFGGLGKSGHTLVIRYDAPPELYAVHEQALVHLKRFFARCGVTDTDAFMAQDPNFMYARTLTPHVTLYKGYDGPLPAIALSPVTMGLMKIVY